jgi:small subunit ribosomal protein S20
MANHASAAKRNRQRVVRTERNRAARASLRTTVKKARAAIAAGEKTAGDAVRAAASALARAVSLGVIHANTAARTTSRIQASLAKHKAG